MGIAGSGYDLVGVTVAGGPLLEPLHIELDVGMTAFYGVNGVGKTWLLRLVSSALTGVALGGQQRDSSIIADLHIRVHDPEGPIISPLLEAVTERLEVSVRLRRGDYLQSDVDDDVLELYREELGARAVAGEIWKMVAMLIDLSPVTDQAPQELGHPMYEGAYGGLLTFRAVGTAQRPAWDVSLAQSVSRGEDFPTLLREASQAWRDMAIVTSRAQLELPGGVDDFKRFFENWGRLNRLYWSDEATRYLRPRGPGEVRPAAHDSWPDWLQVPVLSLAHDLTMPPLQVLGGYESPAEVDEDTVTALLRARAVREVESGEGVLTAAVLGSDHSGPRFSAPVAQALREIERAAQANLADVLVDAPQVRFNVASIEQWFEGARPAWEFLEVKTQQWLPLGELSTAQTRWARLAVALAAARKLGVPVVFLCDEPESGLHRLAERHLARGLNKLSLRTGVAVVVATHSPLLLDSNHMRPVLVHRDPYGAARTSPVALSLVDRTSADLAAEQHGLTVGDLTALMRLTVVVEGMHDELVFAALLREELDGALAGVLPLHGGKHARSVAEARLIFDGTDSQVLLVLDNLEHQKVNEIWQRTASLAGDGLIAEARDFLETLDRRKSIEQLFLHQFGVRALEVGRMDRIHIHGLSMPDVICYLPTSLLFSKKGTWPDLLRRWKKDAAPNHPENLKKWLVTNHYLPNDPKEVDRLIEEAAFTTRRSGGPIHGDLVALALHIQELGAFDS